MRVTSLVCFVGLLGCGIWFTYLAIQPQQGQFGVNQPAEFNILFAETAASRGPRSKALKWWAQELQRRSQGRISVEIFWGGSLVRGPEVLRATGAGMADAGTIVGLFNPADLPIWMVSNTPFMFTDTWVGMRTMMAALNQIPEMVEEIERNNIKILANNSTGPVQLLSAKKPIVKAEDIRGMKINTAGGWTTLLKSLGAVPVTVDGTESYPALERGTVDATLHYIPLVKTYKLYEVARYLAEVNMGQTLGYGICINRDLFESMPGDLQEIMVQTSQDYMDVYARFSIEEMKSARTDLVAGIDGYKMEINQLAPEEHSKFVEAAQPIIEGWLADMAERGLDGQRILADIKALQAHYQQELKDKGYPWERQGWSDTKH